MEAFIQDGFAKFRFHLPEIKAVGIFPGSNDNVATLWEKSLVQPKELSNQPLDPVSTNRIPNFFTDGNPQSRDTPSVLHQRDLKMICLESPAQSI